MQGSTAASGVKLMTTRSQFLFAIGLCGLWASPAAAESAAADVQTSRQLSSVDAATSATASTGLSDPSTYRVATAAAATATAASSTQPSGSGWEFAVTPYLWMSGTKVDIETPQGEDIKVDESFTDILGDLKFAFMGAFEVKHGRFVSVQDIIYLNLGTSGSGPLGFVDVDVDMKLLSTTHLFGYRVVDEGPMFVDLFAGGRITSIKVDLDLTGPLQTIERDSKKTQFGPVIASRFRAPLGGKWGAAIYGDVGGFGVGADLSWQLLGTVQYDLSDRWRLLAGWRHFYAKQSKDDFDVRMKLDGPILGATYRF
jgi:hypothetical protein